MPKMATGYHTDKETGVVTEHEMYLGDLTKACTDFPAEWSKTPKGAAGKAAPVKKVKAARKVKKVAKVAKSATSPLPPATPASKASETDTL